MQRIKQVRKWSLWLLGAAAVTVMVWLSFQPKPIAVDTATVTKGRLVVTVNEDGRTRIKERYIISSPIGGRLSRISLEAGDAIEADTTLIAEVEPTNPILLDARTQKQAEAVIKVTKAAQERAAADLDRAKSADTYAKTEWKRHQDLFAEALISKAQYQQAEFQGQTTSAELKSATMAMKIAAYEHEQAQAALTHASGPNQSSGEHFKIYAPICGHALRILQESSVVVTPGTPLIELGDPADLEVIVDVLSSDAVKIKAGARVILEHWGGNEPLNGTVSRVEPAAFTKISALGVEEQRVWVVIDFTNTIEKRASLGDGFRIEPKIVIWEAPNVIRVPMGALFREGDAWTVFVLNAANVAKRHLVERGQSDGFETGIISGLAPGDTVIVHPSEHVKDEAFVKARD